MKQHYLKIHSGWFYGAGSPKIYGWVKDGYDQAGVGINIGLFLAHERLELEIENRVYLLDCGLAKEFIKRYGSYRPARGVMLGVVSKTILSFAYEVKTINNN